MNSHYCHIHKHTEEQSAVKCKKLYQYIIQCGWYHFLRSICCAQYYTIVVVEYTAENTVLLHVCCIYQYSAVNRSQIKLYTSVGKLQPACSLSLTT